ncbi:unnamed protein product [Caenorhabditis auriculariae]|uniref:Uncharacterized protein n=1 Tax=Caenorhabditis auriculariae TaxID=2777116 RepID=A0A8S1H7B4_9PELO|nr:unnamed protein product [Caenorhabditis auriculariae]
MSKLILMRRLVRGLARQPIDPRQFSKAGPALARPQANMADPSRPEKLKLRHIKSVSESLVLAGLIAGTDDGRHSAPMKGGSVALSSSYCPALCFRPMSVEKTNAGSRFLRLLPYEC